MTVGVALLGQEPLPVRGVLGVEGVAGDHRVEDAPAAVGFGRSSRPSRCASSWREPKVPETCTATDASGRSMEKFATLDTTSVWISPRAERVEQQLALGVLGRPLDHRGVELLAQLVELVEVGADHQGRLVRGAAPGSTSPPRSWCAPSSTACSAPRARRRRRSSARCRSASPAPRCTRPARSSPAPRCPSTARRSASGRSGRTRRPRGRPRGSGSRSGRGGGATAGRRSSGTPARAAGAPRRR